MIAVYDHGCKVLESNPDELVVLSLVGELGLG